MMTTGRFPEEFRPVLQYVMEKGDPKEQKRLDEALWNESSVVYARISNGVLAHIGSTNGLLSPDLSFKLY
jgi:hypothetical protein